VEFTYLRNYTLEDLQQHNCGSVIFAEYFKILQHERSTVFRKTNLSIITKDFQRKLLQHIHRAKTEYKVTHRNTSR